MINTDIQKEINDLKNQISDLENRFSVVLHNHNGFGSSKIKIQDLDMIYDKQITIDPISLLDGDGQTVQVTNVNGAVLGDFILVSAPYDLQDISVTAYIQANETVEIRIQNESGATVDLASGIWRILIIKKIV